MKILHFADLHLGVETYGHINPETGLSTRLEDFLKALDQEDPRIHMDSLDDGDLYSPWVKGGSQNEVVRLSKDDISDNLFQWVQPSRSSGTQQRIADPLAARNTWINSTFLGFDYTGVKNLTAVNKVKFDLWDQRDRIEGLRDTHRFFGLINKADYTVRLGNFRIQPRIKNEFRRETPVLKNDSPRKENMLLFLLVTKFPILKKSEIELGTEFSMFRQLQEPTPAGLQDDYEELIGALQLTNRGDYFGYKLTTQIGMRVGRKFGEKTTAASFITVYAGAE